ncbi:MAG: DUF4412 domain-containing protein, partial [Thermoanaerobaculia bacterium]|nr:DUF4412 domain-containing protein [Thermoanaerobaculia bacterium]
KVLDPDEKEYYVLSIEDTFNALNSMLENMGGMFEMSVADQSVDVTPLGAGEAIEGYSTQKYQVDTSYTLVMKAMGMNLNQEIKTETTTWATDELDEELAAFVQYRTFRTGMEELDALIDEQVDAVKGFPLKAVTKSQITARGRTNTSTSTMTVTDIEKTDIADGEFEVPSGYRQVEGPMAALQRR